MVSPHVRGMSGGFGIDFARSSIHGEAISPRAGGMGIRAGDARLGQLWDWHGGIASGGRHGHALGDMGGCSVGRVDMQGMDNISNEARTGCVGMGGIFSMGTGGMGGMCTKVCDMGRRRRDSWDTS